MEIKLATVYPSLEWLKQLAIAVVGQDAIDNTYVAECKLDLTKRSSWLRILSLQNIYFSHEDREFCKKYDDTVCNAHINHGVGKSQGC